MKSSDQSNNMQFDQKTSHNASELDEVVRQTILVPGEKGPGDSELDDLDDAIMSESERKMHMDFF